MVGCHSQIFRTFATMRLTIISHTEHYHDADGQILGLASTVMEINHLLAVFDTITHVAMLHSGRAPHNVMPYVSDRIKFVGLPAVGGPKIKDKFRIVLNAPKVLSIIKYALKGSDYFQFRAPTGIGVYTIPYLMFFCKTRGWFKYAGNWKQEHAPLAYQFQKWLLEHQSRSVTINGTWPDQLSHCLSFENPCLTDDELSEGKACVMDRTFDGPLQFCFVGRLEPVKGLDLIFEALAALGKEHKKRIGSVHIVGGGPKSDFYEHRSKTLDLDFVFHGLLPRSEVHEVYKRSHVILLPSASEGFPKVIAEAMNYGCLPIVSDVSSIGHYVRDDVNGFLIKPLDSHALKTCILSFFEHSNDALRAMAMDNSDLAKKFTYGHYHAQLEHYILNAQLND